MSVGLSTAGVEIVAGIDIDADCRETYEANLTGATFIQADVATLRPDELASRLGLFQHDDELILVACSPCQFYSQIRTDKTKSTQSAGLLQDFLRFVEHMRPGYVLIENVPRLAKETILSEFKSSLRQMGYAVLGKVLNASDYGVPQNRQRYVLLASRVKDDLSLPKPSIGPKPTVRDFIGVPNGFPSITAGHRDDTGFQHSTASLSEDNLLRIAMTPPDGGDRRAWSGHSRLQLDAYREKGHFFRDVYGRMFWDRPGPTITTKFLSITNGRFGHPTEARAISVREGACLQTFPKEFRFHARSMQGIARQIGNAVPPELARRLGLHILEMMRGNESALNKADGRTARAKATLASVRRAHQIIVDTGRKPTAAAILEITSGSKQTVLKHLNTIRSEARVSSHISKGVCYREAIGIGELNAVLKKLAIDLPSADLDVADREHRILAEAIMLGYLEVTLTAVGTAKLGRAVRHS